MRDFKLDLGASGVVASGANLCFPVDNCDPLVPASCNAIAAHTVCQIADSSGAVSCLPEGHGAFGDACDDTNACTGGFTCVNAMCRRLCAAVSGGAVPSCPSEEGRCVHFQNDPPGVGECTPI